MIESVRVRLSPKLRQDGPAKELLRVGPGEDGVFVYGVLPRFLSLGRQRALDAVSVANDQQHREIALGSERMSTACTQA